LGQRLSADLGGGEVFALTGDLGSGKTTFIQGFAGGLGVERAISPTFILVKRYEIKFKTQNSKLKTTRPHRIRESVSGAVTQNLKFFYHIDLYRLEGDVEGELVEQGVQDLMGKRENVVAVEWADKAPGAWPRGTKWIRLESLNGDKRKISY